MELDGQPGASDTGDGTEGRMSRARKNGTEGRMSRAQKNGTGGRTSDSGRFNESGYDRRNV